MTDPGEENNNEAAADAPMEYGVLGEDRDSPEEKLGKYTGEVGWSYLEKHFEAGSLVYLDLSLDLVSVGKAFAGDEPEKILAWKKTGDLIQPSAPHAEHWKKTDAKFLALVVSPFVLIQPVAAAE